EGGTLGWRKDPSTRAASFTSNEVSAEEHHKWFVGKLSDPSCVLLVIEDSERAIGQGRLDRIDPEMAEVSIGLEPEARGRGKGQAALGLVASEASRLLGVRALRAFVKNDNPASLHA